MTSLPAAVVFKLGPDGQGLWSHAYPASLLFPHADVSGMVDVAVDSHGNTVFVTYMAVAVLKGPSTCRGLGRLRRRGRHVRWSLVELDPNGQFVFDTDASFCGPGG